MRLKITHEFDRKNNPIAQFRDGDCVKYVKISDSDVKFDNIDKISGDELKQMLLDGNYKLLDFLENSNYEKKFLKDRGQELHVNNKSVMFLPDFTKEREMVYLYGMSGSGKSWLTRMYAGEFKARRPDYDIFLFSKIVDDPSLVGMDFTPVDILDEDILMDIDLETLKDSLVIFDDTESVESKAIDKKLWDLKNQIAQEGRHYNISCIITTHQALQYNKTRLLLSECTKYVIFPKSGGQKQMQNLMTIYAGLSKKEFADLKDLDSRWVMVNIAYPSYVVHEKGVKLVK